MTSPHCEDDHPGPTSPNPFTAVASGYHQLRSHDRFKLHGAVACVLGAGGCRRRITRIRRRPHLRERDHVVVVSPRPTGSTSSRPKSPCAHRDYAHDCAAADLGSPSTAVVDRFGHRAGAPPRRNTPGSAWPAPSITVARQQDLDPLWGRCFRPELAIGDGHRPCQPRRETTRRVLYYVQQLALRGYGCMDVTTACLAPSPTERR